jgi:hypothetical protein
MYLPISQMRCVGAENPPCTRCAKAKRQCVIPPSRRSHHLAVADGPHEQGMQSAQFQDHASHSPSFATSAGRAMATRTVTQARDATSISTHTSPASLGPFDMTQAASLPSIYLTSPLHTIDAQLSSYVQSSNLEDYAKHQSPPDVGSGRNSSTLVSANAFSEVDPPPTDIQIFHLLQLYVHFSFTHWTVTKS